MSERPIIGICGKAGSGKDTAADHIVQEHGFAKVALADLVKRMCKMAFDFADEQLWGPSEMRNEPDFRYPRTWAAKAWAEEVKGKIDQKWSTVIKETFGEEASKHFLTTRTVLQHLGTEWGRECYQDVWVDKALQYAKTLIEQPRLDQGYMARYEPEIGVFEETEFQGWRYKGVVIPDVRFFNEVRKIKEAGGKLIRVIRPSAGLPGAAGTHRSEAEQDLIPNSDFDLVLMNVGTREEFLTNVSNALQLLL